MNYGVQKSNRSCIVSRSLSQEHYMSTPLLQRPVHPEPILLFLDYVMER
jgi:hypothetical protein